MDLPFHSQAVGLLREAGTGATTSMKFYVMVSPEDVISQNFEPWLAAGKDMVATAS
jgi:hypothetical protein